MLKRFVVAASLILTSACASLHTVTYAAPFALQLEIREKNQNLPETVADIGGDTIFDDNLPKLIAIAKEIGYTVKAADTVQFTDGTQLWGYTDVDEKVIYLSMNMSANNFIHTFIHELSHAMQPMPQSPEGQVFAESVAAIVVKQLGVNPDESSFAYISRFDDNVEVIRKWQGEIDKLVKFFLERLVPTKVEHHG